MRREPAATSAGLVGAAGKTHRRADADEGAEHTAGWHLKIEGHSKPGDSLRFRPVEAPSARNRNAKGDPVSVAEGREVK